MFFADDSPENVNWPGLANLGRLSCPSSPSKRRNTVFYKSALMPRSHADNVTSFPDDTKRLSNIAVFAAPMRTVGEFGEARACDPQDPSLLRYFYCLSNKLRDYLDVLYEVLSDQHAIVPYRSPKVATSQSHYGHRLPCILTVDWAGKMAPTGTEWPGYQTLR